MCGKKLKVYRTYPHHSSERNYTFRPLKQFLMEYKIEDFEFPVFVLNSFSFSYRGWSKFIVVNIRRILKCHNISTCKRFWAFYWPPLSSALDEMWAVPIGLGDEKTRLCFVRDYSVLWAVDQGQHRLLKVENLTRTRHLEEWEPSVSADVFNVSHAVETIQMAV